MDIHPIVNPDNIHHQSNAGALPRTAIVQQGRQFTFSKIGGDKTQDA